MKKLIISAILIIVIFFLARQGYWLVANEGNVIVYVTNSSYQDEVQIEVSIDDGKLSFTDSHTNQNLSYKRYSVFESFGNHSIEVKVPEKNISYKQDFFLLGVKWINVEFTNKESDETDYELQLSVESSPIVIE